MARGSCLVAAALAACSWQQGSAGRALAAADPAAARTRRWPWLNRLRRKSDEGEPAADKRKGYPWDAGGLSAYSGTTGEDTGSMSGSVQREKSAGETKTCVQSWRDRGPNNTCAHLQ